MTRFTKSLNGEYIVKGNQYEMLIGTRAQVWHRTAFKTSGGLTRNDLLQNKAGRIVSKLKHSSAKKEKRLLKAGYGTKKGKFGFVKLNKTANKNTRSKRIRGTKRMRGSKRMRGGNQLLALSPSEYKFNGQGSGTSGVELQFAAGNATS
jgi:hypothetical protein